MPAIKKAIRINKQHNVGVTFHYAWVWENEIMKLANIWVFSFIFWTRILAHDNSILLMKVLFDFKNTCEKSACIIVSNYSFSRWPVMCGTQTIAEMQAHRMWYLIRTCRKLEYEHLMYSLNCDAETTIFGIFCGK